MSSSPIRYRVKPERFIALFVVLSVLSVLWIASGCEGEQGPAGPAGPPGQDGLSAAIEFSGSYSALRADGTSSVELKVLATTHVGNAVEGLSVSFIIDSGDGSLNPAQGKTNAQGEVTCTYTSGSQSGAKVVLASISSGEVTIRDTAHVWVDPLAVSTPLLTANFSEPVIGSWSQDGSTILFHVGWYCGSMDPCSYKLYKVSAQGGPHQTIGDYRGGVSNFNGSDQVAVWDADQKISVITEAGAVVAGPFELSGWSWEEVSALTWCYSGDSLFVASNTNARVFLSDLAGNARSYEHRYGSGSFPAVWVRGCSPIPDSPDLVTWGSGEEDGGVFLLNATTGVTTQIVEGATWYEYGKRAINGASVTQSGATVVFAATKGIGENYGAESDLFTMPTAGGAETTLLATPMDELAPVWSPDGTKVLFTSDRSGEGYNLYVLDTTP